MKLVDCSDFGGSLAFAVFPAPWNHFIIRDVGVRLKGNLSMLPLLIFLY